MRGLNGLVAARRLRMQTFGLTGSAASLLLSAVLAGPASAAVFQQISVGSTYSVYPSVNGWAYGPNGISNSGYMDPMTPQAHPTYQASNVWDMGGGRTSANQLGVYTENSSSAMSATALIKDVYTLHAPEGSETAEGIVTIGVALEGHAVVEAIPNRGGSYSGRTYLNARIGLGVNDIGTYVIPVFASDTAATGQLSGPGEHLLEVRAEGTHDVTVGVPFELAFEFQTNTSGATRTDGMHTAEILFDLPAGYTITSEMGYVPEPAVGAGVLIFGLLGMRRRRMGH